MTPALRVALAIFSVSVGAACQVAGLESDGRGGAGPGGDGGSGGTVRDAGFTVSLPEGGPADAIGGAAVDTGDGTSCAGEIHEGKPLPVDLLFLLDTSGSMEESAGMKSKWASVRDAITSFVNDPQSAGLGVGLATFPGARQGLHQGQRVRRQAGDLWAQAGGGEVTARPRYCTDMGGETCAPALYQAPIVPVAELPGVRPALEAALAAVVPEGATPTTPAAEGALGHLRARATASAARKQLLVLATDGMPSMCPPNSVETAAAALMAAETASPASPPTSSASSRARSSPAPSRRCGSWPPRAAPWPPSS